MKYLDCSPCDVLEIRKRRLCYNDALHFCWGLFHSLIKQIKVLSICYLTRKTKYILGSVWQSMLRARATAKITASCSWESSLKISVRKIKHLIEKGALTPKSFANIVCLNLNLSLFKINSCLRTNLCKTEECEIFWIWPSIWKLA